jgi:hypothetical protein
MHTMRANVLHIQRVATVPGNAWCCFATAAFARSVAIVHVQCLALFSRFSHGGASAVGASHLHSAICIGQNSCLSPALILCRVREPH